MVNAALQRGKVLFNDGPRRESEPTAMGALWALVCGAVHLQPREPHPQQSLAFAPSLSHHGKTSVVAGAPTVDSEISCVACECRAMTTLSSNGRLRVTTSILTTWESLSSQIVGRSTFHSPIDNGLDDMCTHFVELRLRTHADAHTEVQFMDDLRVTEPRSHEDPSIASLVVPGPSNKGSVAQMLSAPITRASASQRIMSPGGFGVPTKTNFCWGSRARSQGHPCRFAA